MNSRDSRGMKGNTKPSSQKQGSASKRWCFTHHIKDEKSEDELISKIVGTFKSITKYYIFSIEIGSKTQPRHIQGYIELEKDGRLTGVKKLIDNTTHWEKSEGNREHNNNYISKDPIKGPFVWDKSKAPEFTAEELDLIKEEQLYDWQKDIIKTISGKSNDRIIHWFWSEKGEIGKTEFTKYLVYHYGAQFVQGKKSDIMCAVTGPDGKKKISNIYIFGFSRSVEDYVSYDAIETLKDGMIFSGKYESGSRLIPKPHILVFCNFEPDYEAMSKDRWKVTKLDKDEVPPPPRINGMGESARKLHKIKMDEYNKKYSINFN